MPCQALSPPPGSVVLDACAAPGNKTICLANSLDNRGFERQSRVKIVRFRFLIFRILYAIEKNPRRFRELKSNLRSAGVRCAQLFNEDFLQSTIPKDEIEFILLDPSCSGSGIPHRNDSEEKIDEERLSRLSNLQYRMIVHALTEFPKLKRLTYSTCSIHRQENEDVVEKILDEFEQKFRVSRKESKNVVFFSSKRFLFSILVGRFSSSMALSRRNLSNISVSSCFAFSNVDERLFCCVFRTDRLVNLFFAFFICSKTKTKSKKNCEAE